MTSGKPRGEPPDIARSHGPSPVPCWEDSYTTTVAFGARAAITSMSAATSESATSGGELLET